MTKNLTIDDSLFEVGKDFLGKKRRKLFVPILIILAGITLTIIIENLSFGLFEYIFSNTAKMFAYMVSIAGLTSLIISFRYKNIPYYLKTGKKLWRYEYMLHHDQREHVIEYVNTGNLNLIESLPKRNPFSIKVIVYKTQQEDLFFMQAFEYIPNPYKAITDIKIVENEKISN